MKENPSETGVKRLRKKCFYCYTSSNSNYRFSACVCMNSLPTGRIKYYEIYKHVLSNKSRDQDSLVKIDDHHLIKCNPQWYSWKMLICYSTQIIHKTNISYTFYIHNRRTFSAKIQSICTSFRNRKKTSIWRAFRSFIEASTHTIYISRQCMYRAMILQNNCFYTQNGKNIGQLVEFTIGRLQRDPLSAIVHRVSHYTISMVPGDFIRLVTSTAGSVIDECP